ncbi:MAG: ABC transporter ATP-binding protein [Rhizobium sp.]|nr:MAG: ABC transporter ATP-binding protein [Rhizobium sp.]
MPTINLRGAQKNYGVNSANAVSDLDLEIRDGEFMCLLGPSGCGKTTTLRMIAGLENLSGGEIRVGDRVIDSVTEGIFVPPGLRLRKLPKAEREARVERVMQALDIAKYRDRYPSQLSGGQQQRVALARMLAVNPGVLLLDEPLSNLDARLRLEMRAELKRLHKEFKTTIVFVTHDQWEAMTLATTIAVMNEGTLQQMGTPNDIYDRPANRFVAEFVGSPPINILTFGQPGVSDIADRAEAYFATRYPQLRGIASIGMRPEAMGYVMKSEDVPQGSFAGEMTVTGVLPTGGSWILELRSENHTLFLTTHSLPRIDSGDRVFFHVPPEALHAFDARGQRITEADAVLRHSTYN